jgi:hypothetical protein
MSLCNLIVDLKNRDYSVNYPVDFSNEEEVLKLAFLHKEHFGQEDLITKAASLGVYGHSANTPQGLRLAIEYSMQNNLIRFVICTSTLAQGVNLPIRYLIVTSVYQAGEKIRIRDFHNLIGRAGRSGMHTEGSILFADSEVYDERKSDDGSWKWLQVKTLLNPKNSEPCASTLLSIFDPLLSDNGKYRLTISPIEFVRLYTENKEAVSSLPITFSQKFADKSFTLGGLERQITWKLAIISAIESYLMTYWEASNAESEKTDIEQLAKGTLAYFLSDEEKREEIIELFTILADHVNKNFTEVNKRRAYGKTLFGVRDLLEIEEWTMASLENLRTVTSTRDLAEKLWPIISRKTTGKSFKKISPQIALLNLLKFWIEGLSYKDLLQKFLKANTTIKAKTQTRIPKMDTVIELCDNAFAFESTLIIAAVRDIVEHNNQGECDDLLTLLNWLQKEIKYGLPGRLAIGFYELGFSDRILAQELAKRFSNFNEKRRELIWDIKQNSDAIAAVVSKYPAYYTQTLKEIIA